MILCDNFGLQDMDPRAWQIAPSTGFLLATPRVARTGIQIYWGSEADPDGEHVTATDKVRVYRPPEEVFADEAMKTFPYRPITNNHPKDFVDATNWKATASGYVGGEVVKEEDGTVKYVRLPMMVCDGVTINDMKMGKKQFSVGYKCVLDWTSGETPEGEAYDCVQRTIRVNHIAVVDVARGGPDLGLDSNIDDENDGDDIMANDGNGARMIHSAPLLLSMALDGFNINVPDAQTMSIINKSMQDRDTKLADAQKRVTELENKLATDAATAAAAATTAKTTIDTLTAENAALKQAAKDNEITPAKIAAAGKEYNDTVSVAQQVMGSALVVDGKSAADIRKQVVDFRMKEGANGYTDAQYVAAFGALTAGITPRAAGPGPAAPFHPGNTVDHMARSFAPGGGAPYGAPTVLAHRDTQSLARDAATAIAEDNWLKQNGWQGRAWCDANNPFRQRAA